MTPYTVHGPTRHHIVIRGPYSLVQPLCGVWHHEMHTGDGGLPLCQRCRVIGVKRLEAWDADDMWRAHPDRGVKGSVVERLKREAEVLRGLLG